MRDSVARLGCRMRAVPRAGTLGMSRRSGTSCAARAAEFRRIGRLALLGVASLGVSGLAACVPKPVEPVPLPPAPEPFARTPYIQNVGVHEATVLWMAPGEPVDSLRYRPAGPSEVWRPAPVTDRDRGVRAARLVGLPADAEVEYEVYGRETRSGPWTFRTAPEAGTRDTVRVLLFGDSGWGSEAQIGLARRMDRMEWDLAIHVGDIAYYDGSETDFTDRHFRVYGRMLSRIPFFPAVGNHDVRADAGESYDRAFDWPEALTGTRFYSFRWNSVLFLALDTSSHTEDVQGLGEGRGRQYEWLEQTLQAARTDPSVKWIVVYGHHPPYSHAVGISGHGPPYGIRTHLPPLFDRYGVDLMAAGHDHHYERSVAVRDGRPVGDGCGPVYLVQGAGGASRYARDVGSSPISAFASREFSFTELMIVGDRLYGRTFGVDGAVQDEFTIRPYAGPESPGCGE